MPWAWALPGHFTPDGHGAGKLVAAASSGGTGGGARKFMLHREYSSRGPAQGNLSACVLRPEAAGRE